MNKFFTLIVLFSIVFTSCTKTDDDIPSFLYGEISLPTDSGLDATYVADTLYIDYNGAKYFPMQIDIEGLTQDDYVNGVPLASADWDTDYWYTMVGDIYMWSSLYNPLGSDSNQNFTYRIASETRQTQVPAQAVENHLMNADGSFIRDGEFHDNAYTQFNTKLSTRQMFALNENMIGVPITITAQVSLGEDGDNTIMLEQIVVFN